MSIDVLKHSRRQPLAAGLAAILMLSAPLAEAATTWTVNTCDDASVGSGTIGSLRYAATHAASGDTIQISTGLACSAITLATGAIAFAQADITVNGPGKAALTVTGSHNRVFQHSGTGTLHLNNLSIEYGYSGSGGCVYSSGSVELDEVRIAHCIVDAYALNAAAFGGGVFASGNLTIRNSTLADNTAHSLYAGGYGGGAFCGGTFDMRDSTVSGNQATFGGGLALHGNATIAGSTLHGNQSDYRGGGIDIYSPTPMGLTATITNSTISGNQSNQLAAGVYANSANVVLANSTIAFNHARYGQEGSVPVRIFAPGLAVGQKRSVPVALTLQSSVLSNNTYGTSNVENDLSAAFASSTVAVNGSNNLVRKHLGDVSLAANQGNIAACPLLGPLRDNGGPTWTHQLLSGSPAIDKGANPTNASFDQRGSPFARVSGTAADIGAYEVQQADIVFVNGFDGPPTCPG